MENDDHGSSADYCTAFHFDMLSEQHTSNAPVLLICW
jgi:hypothetical protein